MNNVMRSFGETIGALLALVVLLGFTYGSIITVEAKHVHSTVEREFQWQFKDISERGIMSDKKNLNRRDGELVPAEEFDKKVECKGVTCKHRDTCGRADLNPLTKVDDKVATTNDSAEGYIIWGEDEAEGEFPSFIRISFKPKTSPGSQICSGVIIGEREVLTAGHCVKSYLDVDGDLTVYAGDHSTSTKDKHEQEFSVEKKCLAKGFKSEPDPNWDFGVLTIKGKFEFNKYVQPACLPYKPINYKDNKCFSVGAGLEGKSDWGPKGPASIIQKLSVARSDCNHWNISNFDRSRVCYTKSNGHGDTCNGDSGGPVLCLDEKKRWTVAALTSFGSQDCDGTGEGGWTAVYTRVPFLLKKMYDDCGT